MMNKHNLKVGQIIFVEQAYRRDALVKYEIMKIGRKWVTFKYPDERYTREAGRFDLETLAMDGNGTVWLSEEERTKAKLLQEAWSSFQQAVSNAYRRPAAVTCEAIAEARRLLGL